ncbi:villin-2-like [Carex rostrata]
MSAPTKVDPAFQVVGQRIGIEIWRIEDFLPVPLSKSDYGKFYSGDSYIILKTSAGRGGSFVYDIHFWIGKDSSPDEYGTAAIKSIELDASIGGRAVQHREIQGHESDKFLSYFKPCIIPLEGGIASGFNKHEEEKFEARLYICRGKRIVRVKQVPFARTSLNHDDIFILDTETKIYQFNGANSNIQERAKALEVVQYLKDKYHDGMCDVGIVDDGKLDAESDSGEFWLLFGGFAPIGKKIVGDDEIALQAATPKLYSFVDGELKLDGLRLLSKELLENNRCYILDCGSELFVWFGRVTQIDDRKAVTKAAEDLIAKENRPKATRVTKVIQGHETNSFKSKFDSWTAVTNALTSSGEEGRGIVAALLKQQGLSAKGASKGTAISEEAPPLLEEGGKLEVWRINGSAKTPIPREEIGKFYSGDCYIVLYTYHSNDKKEEYFLACWIGKDSIQDDQAMAIRLANTMWGSLKGRPVQGRIYQGEEPPQFIALFQPMVVLKGGVSTGYKKLVAEKNLNDETYASNCAALIQVSGTSVFNNKAVQVDAVAESLCSSDCFLLQSGNSMFAWQGSASSFEQQQWATKVAEFLKPGVTLKYTKEGTESSSFWSTIGGKQMFGGTKLTQEATRDPHLYSFSFNKGKLEIDEIHNFSQDELLTEDMLILDTYAEVFVWIGQSVDTKEKPKAFEIGQQYIDVAVSLEGLSPHVPLYKVSEGNEPCFFKTYFFSWDATKAMAQGNSFQKKLALLFGNVLNFSEPSEKQKKSTNAGEATQRAAALAALSSAFSPSDTSKSSSSLKSPTRQSQGSSQRAAAVAALTGVLTAEQSSQPSTPQQLSRGSSPVTPKATVSEKNQTPASEVESLMNLPSATPRAIEASITERNGSGSEVQPEPKRDGNGEETTFTYEQLKVKSSNPVSGIDYTSREAYLSDMEFETVLGMTKEKFHALPKWKREMLKKKVDLF